MAELLRGGTSADSPPTCSSEDLSRPDRPEGVPRAPGDTGPTLHSAPRVRCGLRGLRIEEHAEAILQVLTGEVPDGAVNRPLRTHSWSDACIMISSINRVTSKKSAPRVPVYLAAADTSRADRGPAVGTRLPSGELASQLISRLTARRRCRAGEALSRAPAAGQRNVRLPSSRLHDQPPPSAVVESERPRRRAHPRCPNHRMATRDSVARGAPADEDGAETSGDRAHSCSVHRQ